MNNLHILTPLPVVLPLLMAALIAATGAFFPRRFFDVLAILTAMVSLCASGFLLRHSLTGPIVYWFGGWQPDVHHFPIGICFVVDPLAAGLSMLVSFLMVCSFVFSWAYFESVKSLYHAMMLVFLAAMNGLCLTGDLFNLFVWFELMTAAAVALCGYKTDETGPLQGALNFAVPNTIGAFLTLTGISFLYAWTGSLNFAGIGQSLADHSPGNTFIALGFLLVVTGFLVKAAAFPFHFWLPDAHAVAPTPVCVLFSGIMVELGLYAIARIYFGIFSLSLAAHEDAVRNLLLTVGIITALVGAIECFGQHHLKRLLAFSTISHAGLMLIGISLLDSHGLAGSLLYLLGHGLLKAALFICAGILLNRFESVDEFDLYGKGRDAAGVGVMMLLGGVGLLSLPPFGTFFGDSLIHHAAEEHGLAWVSIVFIFSGAFTAAAVLRFYARCFLGWGSRERSGNTGGTPKKEKRETRNPPDHTPATMWIPAVAALALSIGVTLFPAVREGAERYAETLIQTHIYAGTVLTNAAAVIAPARGEVPHALWPQLVALVLAIGLALSALQPKSIPAWAPTARFAGNLWHPFHVLQSGRVTDYVAWLALGVAAWSAVLLVQL